jgi:LysR family transcriptional regulator, hydrogen peroxide-inducible genes activator
MTLAELRYLVAVARERNFRHAAEKSFVTQPALSIAIAKLEEELGAQLFERGRRGVSLTPVGERVVAQAIRILDEVARIKEIAHAGRDPLIGSLRLGVIYTVGPYLLPDLIPALHRRAPHMPLEVEENLTANLSERLRAGKLDVIVVAAPFGAPGMTTRPLYEEPFVALVPADHAWAKRASVGSAELATEKVLLLASGHCFSDQVFESCPDVRAAGEVQQGNSLETIRNMVASGLGITVLPASAASRRYQMKLTRVVPFKRPSPSRRVVLAWRRGFPRERAIDAISAAVGELTLQGVKVLSPERT